MATEKLEIKQDSKIKPVPNMIGMIKPRMIWAGHVACMRESRGA
jgi:hypothetical protein